MSVIYIFGGLLLLFVLLTLLAPSVFRINKSRQVDCTVQTLLSYVADFNNYSEWNPWLTRESNINTTISGAPGRAGHSINWEGKITGKGSIELIALKQDSVEWLINYEKPWKTTGKDLWTVRNMGGDQCEINWVHEGRLPWPFARLMGGFVRRSLSIQFEKALDNLGNKFQKH